MFSAEGGRSPARLRRPDPRPYAEATTPGVHTVVTSQPIPYENGLDTDHTFDLGTAPVLYSVALSTGMAATPRLELTIASQRPRGPFGHSSP